MLLRRSASSVALCCTVLLLYGGGVGHAAWTSLTRPANPDAAGVPAPASQLVVARSSLPPVVATAVDPRQPHRVTLRLAQRNRYVVTLTQYLKAAGALAVRPTPKRTALVVDIPVGHLEALLCVRMAEFGVAQGVSIVRSVTPYRLPEGLQGLVASIRGVNDFPPAASFAAAPALTEAEEEDALSQALVVRDYRIDTAGAGVAPGLVASPLELPGIPAPKALGAPLTAVELEALARVARPSHWGAHCQASPAGASPSEANSVPREAPKFSPVFLSLSTIPAVLAALHLYTAVVPGSASDPSPVGKAQRPSKAAKPLRDAGKRGNSGTTKTPAPRKSGAVTAPARPGPARRIVDGEVRPGVGEADLPDGAPHLPAVQPLGGPLAVRSVTPSTAIAPQLPPKGPDGGCDHIPAADDDAPMGHETVTAFVDHVDFVATTVDLFPEQQVPAVGSDANFVELPTPQQVLEPSAGPDAMSPLASGPVHLASAAQRRRPDAPRPAPPRPPAVQLGLNRRRVDGGAHWPSVVVPGGPEAEAVEALSVLGVDLGFDVEVPLMLPEFRSFVETEVISGLDAVEWSLLHRPSFL